MRDMGRDRVELQGSAKTNCFGSNRVFFILFFFITVVSGPALRAPRLISPDTCHLPLARQQQVPGNSIHQGLDRWEERPSVSFASARI